MAIKVTLTVPPGQEATPVYEAAGGVEVELIEGPYWDGDAQEVPLSIVYADGPMWTVSDGSMQAALPMLHLSAEQSH